MTSEVFFDLDSFHDVCAQQLFETLGDDGTRSRHFATPRGVAGAHPKHAIANPRCRRRPSNGRTRRNLPREAHFRGGHGLIVQQGLKRAG